MSRNNKRNHHGGKRKGGQSKKSTAPAAEKDKDAGEVGQDKRLNWFEITMGIVTILSFVVALVAIFQSSAAYRQSSDQFDDSGAVFEIHPLSSIDEGVSDFHVHDGVAEKTDAWAVVPLVVVNTGRTQGTIVSLERPGLKQADACIPDMDDDGYGVPKDAFLLSHRRITLQPGESRLILFTHPAKTADGGTKITIGGPLGAYRMWLADGTRLDVDVAASDVLPPTVADHYRNQTDYPTVVSACAHH